MTLSQAIYVLEVAACKSVSLAAKRLYISQSAVSQQIKKLEKELGYPLFDRTPYGLELTREGERFCEEGRGALEAWTEFSRKVQRADAPARSVLRIGMGARVYSNGLFPDILAFFDARQDIEVSFITEANSNFSEDLRRQRIDLALDVIPPSDEKAVREEFYACPLIVEEQCVLMAETDRRAKAKSLSFRDLQGATMMSGLENSQEARHLELICQKHGIMLDRIYRSDGIHTVMNMVRAGKGITLGPASFAGYYQVRAVPLRPRSEEALFFLCPRKAVQAGLIRELLEYLTELCKEKPGN